MRRFDAQLAGGGRVGHRPRLPVLASVWAVVALATLPTLLVHSGSAHNVLLVAARFASVLTILVLRPFSAFFAALVFFLGIGLWVKFAFHMITGTPLMEPVGDFRPTVAPWDEVLVVSSVALLAIAAVMLVDWRLGGAAARCAPGARRSASCPPICGSSRGWRSPRFWLSWHVSRRTGSTASSSTGWITW